MCSGERRADYHIEHVKGNKRKEAEKNSPLLISMKRERKARRDSERERETDLSLIHI